MGYPDYRRASADNGDDLTTPIVASSDFNSHRNPAAPEAHDTGSRYGQRACATMCGRWSEELRESLRGRRLYTLFALVNLVNYMDRGIIPGGSEEFNIFIRQKLHTNQPDVFLGLLQSAFILGFSVACLIFARLARVHSPFALMAFGLSVWCASSVMAGLAHPLGSYAVLFFGRLMSGVGEASFITVVPPLITETAPPGERGLWLALFYTAMPVGAGLGYVYGSVMATSSLGWPWAFFLETLVMAPLALACSLVPHEHATTIPNSAHYGTSSVAGLKPASNVNVNGKRNGGGGGRNVGIGNRSVRRHPGRDDVRLDVSSGRGDGNELEEVRKGAGAGTGAGVEERNANDPSEEDTSDESWSVEVDRTPGSSARPTWPEHDGVSGVSGVGGAGGIGGISGIGGAGGARGIGVIGGADRRGEMDFARSVGNGDGWNEAAAGVSSREGTAREGPYEEAFAGPREEVGLVEMGGGVREERPRKQPPPESRDAAPRVASGSWGQEVEGLHLTEDLWRVVNRPLFFLVVLGAAANAAVTAGMSTFGTGFVTSLELLNTETAAAATFGSVICAAGIVGTPAGGAFIDSADPEGRLSDGRKLLVVLRQGFWLVSGATVFLVLATAQSALVPFLILTFLGGTLLFACTPHMNLAVMLASPYSLRPLALAINSVAVHALGDVPSPAAIGAIKDALAPHCAGTAAEDLRGSWVRFPTRLGEAVSSQGQDALGEISDACRSERSGLHLTLFIMSAWLLWMSLFFAIASVLEDVALKRNLSPLVWTDLPRLVSGDSGISDSQKRRRCPWPLRKRKPEPPRSTLSIEESDLDGSALGKPLLVSSP